MLITIARRMTTHRALDRTLLIVVVVAVAVILGLLAMHSVSTHVTASGHARTVAAENGTAHTGGHPAELSVGDSPGAVPAECANCADDDGMGGIACVLALLVVAVLVVRSTAWRRPFGSALGRSTAPTRHPSAQRPLAPPSLTALCIIRT
ncbi:DUF6153 family protein [Microbacterium sp. ZW T5_45]|uniref:DUF6153 family protein n=1 Tax=Microbacterium sp. ZW T5_45 TaxID=3378080 RepID=UPI003852834C